jgi:hypothetical protein
MGMDIASYPNPSDTKVCMDIHWFTLYVHHHNNVLAKQQHFNTCRIVAAFQQTNYTSIAVQRHFKNNSATFQKTQQFIIISGGVEGRRQSR